MSVTLEIACFSREDALAAAETGADRIELCRDYAVGGLRPTVEDLTFVKQHVDLPVFVMVREREGAFVYDGDEIERMKTSAQELLAAEADGLVFGALTGDGRVNEPALREMVDLAAPKPLTFHRAFDEVRDSFEALDALVACGIARVLTSGGAKTALEGAGRIDSLVRHAGSKLRIMPGGGVRAHNVREVIERAGATEIHSAARTDTPRVDAEEVRRLVNALV